MSQLNTTNQMVREFERVLGKSTAKPMKYDVKTRLAIKTFKRANPGWTIIHPWIEKLSEAYNPGEWMLKGKFRARGPLGNERTVNVSVYRDGIRIF